MKLCFNSRDPFVCKNDRWIASINDGSTIFEDKTPGIKTAWRRLANFLENNKLKITNLRLEYGDKSISLLSAEDVEGYWWSTKEELLVGENIYNSCSWVGIGQVKMGLINIIWVRHDGLIKEEVRPHKLNDPAVILNG